MCRRACTTPVPVIQFSADVAIIFLYYYFNDFFIYIYIKKNYVGWLLWATWGWPAAPCGLKGWLGHPNNLFFFFLKKIFKIIYIWYKIYWFYFILFFDISAQEEDGRFKLVTSISFGVVSSRLSYSLGTKIY
jgi:hypothetical protein